MTPFEIPVHSITLALLIGPFARPVAHHYHHRSSSAIHDPRTIHHRFFSMEECGWQRVRNVNPKI